MSGDEEGPSHEVGLEELAFAIFAAKGINSGLWRLAAKLTFAGISAQLSDRDGVPPAAPAGIVAITGLALFPVTEPGPLVFDASKRPGKAAHVKPTSKLRAKPAVKPAKKTRNT